MKRILCLLLCLMLVIPSAIGETADTLSKRFARQLTSGNGIRGYLSLTASGVAEWLNALLPFTAAKIQIRAVGESQGDMSELVDDDDDWQIKLYAENADKQEVGTTWLFGDPAGVYFKSELLPGELLSIPAENAHVLYQLFKGEFSDLFFNFDPFELMTPGAKGNVSSYNAIADLLGIPEETWTTAWMPVIEKYFLHLDLWLAGYGEARNAIEEGGALTLSTTYTIPAKELKEEAKYLIGLMIYDYDLQNLLLPYVSMEQRVTYLNPSLMYFYEACIDALPLEGDIVLSREMSAQGDIVSTSMELPIPEIPEKLVAPLNQAFTALFELPYDDVFSGHTRIAFTSRNTERVLKLTGKNRTVEIVGNQEQEDESTTTLKGTLRIIPNAAAAENAFSGAFTCTYGHRLWQDEKYLDHDTRQLKLAVEPNLDMIGEDDPFRSSYIEFSPVAFDFSIDFRTNPNQENYPVQININADAKLPDAALNGEIVLRITPSVEMQLMNSLGAENIESMMEARKAELGKKLIENAALAMANLNGEAPAVQPTAVPALAEENEE